MFSYLGKAVARAWPFVIVVWLAALFASQMMAPPWNVVAIDKEFGFLPASVPSQVAEREFQKAFPTEGQGSSIVIVLTDDGSPEAVRANKNFIGDTLEPALRKLAEAHGGLASTPPPIEANPFAAPSPASKPARTPIVDRIRTPNAPGVGALLLSKDQQALIVVIEMTTEFLSSKNWPIIDAIQQLLRNLETEGKVPAGTRLALTGSAVLGRDHTQAELQSAHATEWLTIVMVIGLLVVIYRAPLLAIIPLLTVYVSVRLALNLLSILSGHSIVTVFQGLQIFITVLVYGAGVDYCLFLMARYKEELDQRREPAEAISHSVGRVGSALTASAATVICGIGMMFFARFGKFQQAGIAIPFALFIVLCATLTFSAALLRMVGRWAFWPQVPAATDGETRRVRSFPGRSILRRIFQPGEFYRGWEWIGRRILIHPAKILVITALLMTPFAVVGILYAGQVAYDILANLPSSSTSVQGVEVLKEHFPQGILGPISILLVDDQIDFHKPQGRQLVARLTDELKRDRNKLNIADVRSLTAPLGITGAAERGLSDIRVSKETRERAIEQQALEHYTTDLGGRRRIGTRFDVVLKGNPFAHRAEMDLNHLQDAIRAAIPANMQLYVLGATASIRDLSVIRDSDHTRIAVLVLAAVYVILVLLLRRPFLCLYMVVCVLFSYYATIGVTYIIFWGLDPHAFAGLDWKVTTFLFTILIAVGEDYNIFLMSRVYEEQRQHGPLHGILCAMTRTGPIISSCGIIMAGTFISLMAGSLSEMKQLGFALAFGVLVDTFIVRPILVPAFLILIEKWKQGHDHTAAETPESAAACH